MGSGFFVRPDTIVTNYHVIRGASSASLKQIGSSKVYEVDGITGIDKTNDLVFVTVKGLSAKALPLVVDLAKVDIGQDIFALGNPQGLEGTISQGIVSSKGLRQIGQENLIQITAPISPGSSGGPVVNKFGQVIGIASASLTSGQNLNFAVPAAYVGLLLNSRSELMSFSEFAKKEMPSLEETTDWLSKTLSGLQGRTLGSGYVTNTSLKFTGCRFQYSWYSEIENAELLTAAYSGSMADFAYVGSAPGTVDLRTEDDKVKPVMFLDLTFKDESIDSFASRSLRRELDSRYPVSQMSVYLNDKSIQQSVERAFLRLKGYCEGRH